MRRITRGVAVPTECMRSAKTMSSGARHMIYLLGCRPSSSFAASEGDASISREVAQDFVHAAGIHWRRERSALPRIDYRGDWEDVVSQSTRDASVTADLFSMRREVLDLHLVALDAVLVRVFDLTLRSPSLPRSFDLGLISDFTRDQRVSLSGLWCWGMTGYPRPVQELKNQEC